MNRIFKLKTFKFFILTYLIIMLIPLTVCFILYSNLLSTLNKNNEAKYNSIVSQSQQIINQYMEGISNIPAQIISNSESYIFLNSNILDRRSNTYQPSSQSSIISYLDSYTSSNPLINDIYLYSHKSDCFLSTETSIPSSSYGNFFKIGDMDYSTLKATVLSNISYNRLYYQTDFVSSGTQKNCFYFITTVPVQEANEITGAILVSVDSEKLFKAISKDLPSSSYFYFYDSNQKLIAQSEKAPNITLSPSSKFEESIDGIEYTFYRTNEENSYNYVLAVPSKTVVSDIRLVRLIISIAILMSCIISGILALYFTKRNTKPIERILNTLTPYSENDDGVIEKEEKEKEKENEYNVISTSLDRLIRKDQHSTKMIEETMPILHSNFLRSIISGDLMDCEEIALSMKKFNINFTSENFLLCIASAVFSSKLFRSSLTKTVSLKAMLTNRISSKFECLHTEINENQTIFLIGLDNEEKSTIELEEVLNNLALEANEIFNVKLKLAISNPYNSFFDTFYKYCDLKNTVEHGIQTSYGKAIWCTKGVANGTGYFYPSDVEKRIIYSFQHKNIDIVFETLDMVLEENHEKRVLSTQVIKHLYSNIRCTVFKILYNLSLPTEVVSEIEESYYDSFDLALPDFFALTKAQLSKAHSFTNENSQENIAESMMQYINTHYSDPSLSRNTFSNQFHISEAYTSKFFREYTGYQFTEYVSKVRIENACKLLSETNLTIDKISQAVGYNSDVSFRRAFKAAVGMTPKEYKNAKEN